MNIQLKNTEGLFGIAVNPDMNSQMTFMLSDLQLQTCVFNAIQIIEFLAGINCDYLSIKSKNHRKKAFYERSKSFIYDRCINEYQNLQEYDGSISIVKNLKVFNDSKGNYFFVQIIKEFPSIAYSKISFKISKIRVF